MGRKLFGIAALGLGLILAFGFVGRMFAPRWDYGPAYGPQGQYQERYREESRGYGPQGQYREESRGYGPQGQYREESRGYGPQGQYQERYREEWRGGPGHGYGHGHHGYGRGHHGWGKPFFMPFFWWSGLMTKLALIALIVAIFLRGRQLRRNSTPGSSDPPAPEAI